MSRNYIQQQRGVRGTFGSSGRLVQAPAILPLGPSTTASNPLGETSFTCIGKDGVVHTITVTQRGGAIVGWQTGGSDILNFADLGRFIGPAEFFKEDINLGTAALHNPNYGGQGRFPATTPKMRWTPSPTIFFRIGGTLEQRIFESAVIPLDFDASGQLDPNQDHGGDEVTVACYWRMRQYQRMQWNIRGLNGVHRHSWWTWHPKGWQTGAPFFWGMNAPAFCLQKFGNVATSNFYDPVANVLTAPAFWVGQDNLQVAFDFTNLGTISGDKVGNFASPFTTQYTAMILDSGAGQCFGQASRLRNDTRISTLGAVVPQQMTMSLSGASSGTGGLNGSGTTIMVYTMENNMSAVPFGVRPPGWIGMTTLYFTGTTVAQVAASQRLAWQRGLYDEEPDFTVPQAVLDSMQFQD